MALGLVQLADEDRGLYIDVDGSASAPKMHRYTDEEPWGLLPLINTESNKVAVILKKALVAAAAGNRIYDAIAIDSITELTYNEQQRIEGMFDSKYGEVGSDERTLKRWGEILVSNINLMQTLVALSVHGTAIAATASAERGSDPAMPGIQEAQPVAAGGIKNLVGKYFDISTYIEVKPDEKTKAPKHIYHMVKNGPWRVKNRWEREWLADPKTFPMDLINPSIGKVVELALLAAERKLQEDA